MRLRDYQERAVQGALDAFSEAASALVVLPTGCGKTVVFAEAIRRMRPRRAMVVAHREELVFQARDKIAAVAGFEPEVEMAQFRADGTFGVPPQAVVSTVQTLTAGGDGGGRMSKFDPADFGLLVIDEAHHAVADSYRRVVDWFRRNPELRVLGVTATPDRADEAALGAVFETVAAEYGIADAVKDGWLVPVSQQVVTVGGLDFSKCRTTAGDLNGADLAEVMEAEEALHGVASPTMEIAGGRRTLVFAASVDQAERLAEIFNRHRDGCAESVSGATPKDERRRILGDFAAGKTQFLCNVGVLTEGFDDPGVEVVAMARPTKSRALYAQMAGRATRPAGAVAAMLGGLPDAAARRAAIAASAKPGCLVLDFAGNAGRHKLVTAADILGGKMPDEIIEAAAEMARKSGKPENVEELLAKAAEEAKAKRLREAAKRASVTARVRFSVANADPFDVFDLTPERQRGWDSVKRLTDRQRAVLERNRIDPDKLTYRQGKQILDEIFRRLDFGMASYQQTRILKANGITRPMTFEEARAEIDAIASRQGWGRTA